MKLNRIVALTLFALGCWLVYYYATRPSEDTIRGMISREVPIGSSARDVIIFLDGHHIEHDAEINSDPTFPRFDNTLSAYINPNTRVLWLTSSITMTFKFSKDRRLTGYTVSQDWSGVP
jgi:hypothetical protein